MKKVSTVVAKQSRNISQQKLTIGLDLGDRNSWYCVVDEAGQIELEQRVGTSAKALQEVFGALPRSRMALEIGTHSPWISRLLSELGHEVIVANARKVRLIGESRKKILRWAFVRCWANSRILAQGKPILWVNECNDSITMSAPRPE